MTAHKPILLIGSLPPFRSAAAALCLQAAETLAQDTELVCVIDDLAPPPPKDLDFPVIRLRDLRAQWTQYANWPRLFIAGAEGDSLFALDFLHDAPGAVMPAELSLFPLAESVCRARGNWPQDYWAWLEQRCGDKAATLYSARFHHRRESVSQKREAPAFNLLLGTTTALIAPSPATAAALKASGLSPTLTLNLAPTATAPSPAPKGHTPGILYISEDGKAARQSQSTLAVFKQLTGAEHRSIHPGARHLTAAVHEADIVVFLNGEDHACAPALGVAMTAGKCVITAGQKWAGHLPAGTHLSIPHSQAFDTLAISIGALLCQPTLKMHIEHVAKAYTVALIDTETAAVHETLLHMPATEVGFADIAPDPSAPSGNTTVRQEPVKADITTAALIGAVPPASILEQMFPKLTLDKCPRFATPSLATRLAAIAQASPDCLLARMRYEAPVIKTTESTKPCHRMPVSFKQICKGLKTDDAISFACNIEGAIPSDLLVKERYHTPRLSIKIVEDEKPKRPETQGFLEDAGLFWSLDLVRHSLQCIMMVGMANTVFRVRTDGDNTSYMVATDTDSMAISGNIAAAIHSDNLGLLTFRLLALDPVAGTPLMSTELRKQLAETGLILEWSMP